MRNILLSPLHGGEKQKGRNLQYSPLDGGGSRKREKKNLDPPGNGGKRWNEVPQAHEPQTRKNRGKDQKLVPLLVALEEAQQQTPEKANVLMEKG